MYSNTSLLGLTCCNACALISRLGLVEGISGREQHPLATQSSWAGSARGKIVGQCSKVVGGKTLGRTLSLSAVNLGTSGVAPLMVAQIVQDVGSDAVFCGPQPAKHCPVRNGPRNRRVGWSVVVHSTSQHITARRGSAAVLPTLTRPLTASGARGRDVGRVCRGWPVTPRSR